MDQHLNIFKDRRHAGQLLAGKLDRYAGEDTRVLALARGGVVVGHEVAKALKVPLGVLIVRKIGAPSEPELAIGAVAENNVRILDNEQVRGFSAGEIQETIKKENDEVDRRRRLYRRNQPLPLMENKTVILIDDGLATGYTALAAILSTRKLHPKKLIFAAPVCAFDSLKTIAGKVDTVVSLISPSDLGAIGQYYLDFRQVTDEQVATLLKSALRFPTHRPKKDGLT